MSGIAPDDNPKILSSAADALNAASLKQAAVELAASKAALDAKIASPSLLHSFLHKAASILVSLSDPVLRGAIMMLVPDPLQGGVLKVEQAMKDAASSWLDSGTIVVTHGSVAGLVEVVHDAMHDTVAPLVDKLGSPKLTAAVSEAADALIGEGAKLIPQTPA